MGLKITQVDAFTSQPFGGNPAAVCILLQPRHAARHAIAARLRQALDYNRILHPAVGRCAGDPRGVRG